jgi:hypothetical protein
MGRKGDQWANAPARSSAAAETSPSVGSPESGSGSPGPQRPSLRNPFIFEVSSNTPKVPLAIAGMVGGSGVGSVEQRGGNPEPSDGHHLAGSKVM